MSSIESLLHFIEMTDVSFCSMPLICFSVMYKRLSFVVCVFLSFRVCMLVAVPTVMTLCALRASEARRAHRSQNLSDLTSVLISVFLLLQCTTSYAALSV